MIHPTEEQARHAAAAGPGESARRVVRAMAYVAVIGVAIAGAYFATRGSRPAQTAAGGHDHGAMTGSGEGQQPVSLTQDQMRRIGVTLAAVTVGPFEQDVRAVGQVTYDETRVRTITVRVDGFVEGLVVNATGQPVSAGAPLFSIYSPMLVAAQEELLLARRLEQQVASGDDEARRNAADLVAAARRRLAYWDIPESEVAATEQAGKAQRTLTLRSPASGYVLQKNVVEGQKVMAGDPLYRVADLDTVWLEGEVFEQNLAAVRTGQMVHADFDALPGEHRMGRITFIYPTISPDTRTARLRVSLPNEDLVLKPGMYATLNITGTARSGVMTVPRDAVLSTGKRNIVFVKEAGGQLAPREVALGMSNDERVEILRGLSTRDTVVASATFLVDAESNLGKALGGMGEMPGMDMTQPPKPLPMQPTSPPGAKPDPHAGHKVP